jgi:hypothetical protein
MRFILNRKSEFIINDTILFVKKKVMCIRFLVFLKFVHMENGEKIVFSHVNVVPMATVIHSMGNVPVHLVTLETTVNKVCCHGNNIVSWFFLCLF